jgi:ABC-type lipoprotein export system ATPase subunit
MTLLKVASIKKSFFYPTEIESLSDISFEVEEREIVAIMGPSGSGKSTLLQIIGSLETATKGTIFLGQEDISSIPPAIYRQKHVGFVFQSFYLLEDHTALENLLLPCSIARKSIKKGSPAFDRASQLIRLMGLEDRKHFPARLLSGGEKQRIAVARALMNDPSLLLADEPTGNLDSRTGESIMEVLLGVSRDDRRTLVVVTHDERLAQRGDRLLRIVDGRIAMPT